MPRTILIVEDDDLLRDLTAESLLSLYAITILTCANADEALHRLSHDDEVPSLVFTDIQMPGHMDGLGLAHEIWRRWPTLPVILTSGDAIIDTGLLPARSAFLPKPWGISDLTSLIDKLVSLPPHVDN
ncbi:response regulator [Pseudomonas plecoglossicida]|uniref:response regulator n=1 Tax=Pseudomonas plecoglossicida TaxID=70775 RepID=UPI003D190DCD